MKKERGLSLLEIMVAAALGLLLLTYASRLLIQISRNTLRAQAQVAVQQTVTITMGRLISDVQTSTPAGLTWQPDLGPAHLRALAVQPLRDVDGDGLSVYADKLLIIYYYDAPNQLLRRREWMPPHNPPLTLNPSEPVRLSDTQLLTALSTQDFSLDSSIKNLDQFELSNPYPPPNLGNPLELKISGRQHVVSGKSDEFFEVKRSIVLRNPK